MTSFLNMIPKLVFHQSGEDTDNPQPFAPPPPIAQPAPETDPPVDPTVTHEAKPPAAPAAAPGGPTTAITSENITDTSRPLTAPNTSSGPQVGAEKPKEEAPAAPTVTADETQSNRQLRDPQTGIVLDKDANNGPEKTKAHTYADESGVVHYTKNNPDGSPKNPMFDAQGFAALTPEQQRAVMSDYKTAREAWKTSHASQIPPYMTEEEFGKLDQAGQDAAVDKWLSDTAPPEEPPKVSVDENGVVRYPEKDADGNITQPWKLEGWKDLTPEQQKSAMAYYADQLEQQTAAAADPNAPVDPASLEGLSPEEQINRIRGIKPPTVNPDGSTTAPDPSGGDKATVTKKDGKVVSRTLQDGTSIVYGDNGMTTTTGPDGLVTTVDSEGKKTYSAPAGTEAHDAFVAKQDAGFNWDGTKIPTEEAWYKDHATDPKHPTQKDRDAYEQDMASINEKGWSAGEAVARAAVRAGLISQDLYNQMAYADFSHSFGAWAAQNADIVAAISASNLDIMSDRIQPSMRQRGVEKFDPDADTYFSKLRGNVPYVAPHSLVDTDFTDGTQRDDPRAGAEALAFETALRRGEVAGASTYYDPNAPPPVIPGLGAPIPEGVTYDPNRQYYYGGV